MKTDPKAAQRNIDRKTVWEPVLAIVSVNKDGGLKSFIPKGEDNPVSYLECRKAVEYGFIPLYVFGEGLEKLRGKMVPCRVELRTKTERGQTQHYLRAEVLPEEATRPDVKLYVGGGEKKGEIILPKDKSIVLLESFPHFEGAVLRMKEGERVIKKFVIGFVSATKSKRAKAA